MTQRDVVQAADLFCGSGGTTTGLARAAKRLGIDLELVAINHWDIAIDTHSRNHPEFKHYCCDIGEVDPLEAFPSGKLRLLVASPECTHFSNARGARPVSNQNRASVKYVLRWASKLEIQDILIENVREFRDWGPIHRNHPDPKMNGRPIKARKGEYFRRFIRKLEKMGYRVEHRILRCADYGDPTTRQRLFIIARLGGKKIVWPERTHSSKDYPQGLFDGVGLRPYRTARNHCIDWSLKGESIFNRKRPLSPNTMKRIMAGLRKFSGKAFVLGQQSGATPRSVDEPIPTVAGAGAISLSEPFIVPFFGEREGQQPRTHSVDEPLPAVTSHGAGGLVEPYLVVIKGTDSDKIESTAKSVDDPVPTVTARSHLGLVEPYLVVLNGTGEEQLDNSAKSVDEPVPTVTAQGGHIGLAEPFLINIDHSGEKADHENRAYPIDNPVPTVTGKNRLGLVEPFLVEYHGGEGAEERTRSVDEPLPTQDTSNRFGLVEPFLVKVGGPEGQGREPRSVDEPLPTVLGQDHTALVEPFLVSAGGPEVGPQSIDDPLNTVLTRDHMALVEPFIIQMEHGSQSDDEAVKDIDKPMPTLTSADGWGLVDPFLMNMEHSGEASGHDRRVHSVDKPIKTVTGQARFGLVESSLSQPSEKPKTRRDDAQATGWINGLGHAKYVCPNCDTLHWARHKKCPACLKGKPQRISKEELGNRYWGLQPKAPNTNPAEPDAELSNSFILNIRGGNDGYTRASSVDEPLPTVTGASPTALVQPFLLPNEGYFRGNQPRSLDEPIPTVTQRGAGALVQPFIIPTNHGKDERVHSVDNPMPTVTSVDAWAVIEPYLIKYFGQGENVHPVDEPLPTITGRDRFGIVIPELNGAILDIRFRMLQYRELARAHSYGDDYEFAGNREQKVKQIGNSVPVYTAEALCYSILSS